MAFENPILVLSKPAAASLAVAVAALPAASSPFIFVQEDGSGRLEAANATDVAWGVLQNKPTAVDQTATVMVYGVTRVIASAAFAVNAKLSPDASGKAKTAVATGHVAAIALEAAAGANEVVAVLLTPGGGPVVP